MEGVLSPRESGQWIAETAKDVFIDNAGVTKVAQLIVNQVKKEKFDVTMWKNHPLNPKTSDRVAVDWVFLADTLNFSFWSGDATEKFMVKYGGVEHTGYWSLCAALNRALDEGIPILDASYYATISRDDFMKVFRSDSDHDIPMIDERIEVMHEAGKALMQKYEGTFVNCVKECDKSAQRLLQLVLHEFPAYRDTVTYNGKQLGLYKRAQILIADIWGACEGKGLGEFTDIDTLTMFADYRIPQALAYFGAMKYSDSLMDLLRKDTLMQTGDRLEVEIRGVSIWVTELVREEVERQLAADPATRDSHINSVLIDHYLWDYRRDHAVSTDAFPFHKVRCIYY
ncbi:queuosine 5'-phosphate N-glycosylase/hydrolase-like [Babylonia areolata]|uniref:queuosine 5'-phosphate N-glycosylase/hydrolase-like n=1 Tax=Babylonia areolata TaxID=304850 RepID=UPI003FD3D8FE